MAKVRELNHITEIKVSVPLMRPDIAALIASHPFLANFENVSLKCQFLDISNLNNALLMYA